MFPCNLWRKAQNYDCYLSLYRAGLRNIRPADRLRPALELILALF
jgi:hypothetical protein